MLTTDQVADYYQLTPRRILAIAASRAIKPALVVGRAKLWRPRDLPRFKPGDPGRPPSPK